jgi:hypothetical protein
MKSKSSKKFKYIIPVILALVVALFVLYKFSKSQQGIPLPQNAYKPGQTDTVQKDYALINVPFTSQAPTGNWSDPRQEDGCEEASLYMAWLWINNQTTTPSVAEKTIDDMSDFELAKYGNYHDFDAEDTAKLMQDYYHYTKLNVVINPTLDQMKNELSQDHVILIPTNGQKLNNPHYKQPGPTTHMLVVKGFDNSKQQFITNDPGTRYGEGYTYNFQTVYNAMVDYPSGIHESQVGRPKAMIVIEK